MPNNRRHGRVRAKGVASHVHEGSQLITGLAVENLSRGGAFIRCATPMPIGTPVMLDLVRPGLKRALQMTGRVVSIVTPEQANDRGAVPGMGVQFDPYSAGLGERLNEVLLALGAGPEVLMADPAPVAFQNQFSALPEPRTEKVPALEYEEPARAPPPPPPQPPPSVAVPENTRLMVQVKGLLMELGEWQQKAAELERVNARLKAEVDRLTAWIEANDLKRPSGL